MESSSEREDMNGKKTIQRFCIYMDSIVLVTLTWKHIKLVFANSEHNLMHPFAHLVFHNSFYLLSSTDFDQIQMFPNQSSEQNKNLKE